MDTTQCHGSDKTSVSGKISSAARSSMFPAIQLLSRYLSAGAQLLVPMKFFLIWFFFTACVVSKHSDYNRFSIGT